MYPNRQYVRKICRDYYNTLATPFALSESARLNAIASDEGHHSTDINFPGDRSSRELYDTVDNNDNRVVNIGIPNLHTDTHLTHGFNDALSLLSDSVSSRKKFEAAQFMRQWNRKQQSGLLNMIDITKRSQLKPVFTNQLYKHRQDVSLVPSMLTLQYLNEGRHFGVKAAQLVQNHPQIKALSDRTTALEASKHGTLSSVPLAKQIPHRVVKTELTEQTLDTLVSYIFRVYDSKGNYFPFMFDFSSAKTETEKIDLLVLACKTTYATQRVFSIDHPCDKLSVQHVH